MQDKYLCGEALVSDWKQCMSLTVGPDIAAWLGGFSGHPARVETSSLSCRVTATAAHVGGHGCRGFAIAGCNPCLLRRLLGRRGKWEGPAGISVPCLQARPEVMENNLNAVPAPNAGELRLFDLIQVSWVKELAFGKFERS